MATPNPTKENSQTSNNNKHVQMYHNLVDWALFSGNYDGDRKVLIDVDDPSRYLSRRDVIVLVSRLAGMFKPGKTVCLHVPNDILYPVLALVILASQCKWTGANPAYTSHELSNHLRQSHSDYLIVMPEDMQSAKDTLHTLGPPTVEIIMFSDVVNDEKDPELPDHQCMHDWLTVADLAKLDRHTEAIHSDDVAMLQSTSGTTGHPKMATRTHRAVMLETAAIEDNHSAKPYAIRRLWCTPIFHAFSAPEMVINALRLGIPTYVMKRFDDSFARKVAEFSITEIAAAPSMLNKLIQDSNSHHKLQTIRTIFTGGTVLSPELRRRVLSGFLHQPRIVQVWGMTEGGWFATFKYPEDDTTGSVGRLIPGHEIKISPSTGFTTVNDQIVGELLIRGQHIMIGYHDNPQATAAAFEDGWLKTGDVGYVKDGKIYFLDRIKDLIKVNGWQVAPAEIEDAVLRSKHIRDAAAISVGCGVYEHPLVFVVATEAVTILDIERLLRERLARYKVARIQIKFVDEIPRNYCGKISRNSLKAHALELGWITDEKDTMKRRAEVEAEV